ncbi:MAG: hypothetical protein JNL75_04550 [Chitinophagales bacterium]|nr:hypothetical protein [Chitinophagales bacterium]
MKILLAFFLFINSSLFASYNESIRQELGKALTDGKKADEMIARFEKNLLAEHQGYLAVAYMMKSNHASMPWTKLKYFYKGKKLLEKAIKEEPERIELRFFRYEIQVKIPKGLNYNNMEEDKNLMLEYLRNEENKKFDQNLYTKIAQLKISKG